MIKVRCPICEQTMQAQSTAEWPHFPFCSKRCRLIDLGRWLREDYRLASEEDEDIPPDLGDANTPS
jgi:endogenous inhibitor of DNA gyrase (YacG/DUF329 family)